MSNGIGRLRTLGIAKQVTFGTAAASPVFVLPYLSSPVIEAIINKLENESALGSAYGVNAVENGNRMANVPLDIKIDEDHLPLFFTQRFSVASVTAAGETTVYDHTLTYQTTTQNWFTLFLQDDQRTDYIVKDALFDTLNIEVTAEFLKLTGNAVGTFPTEGSVSNTVVQPKDFVGRHAIFSYGDFGGAKTSLPLISANLNHAFQLNDDESKHSLGNQDLAANELTQDRFETELVGLEVDRDNWDDYKNNQKKIYDMNITDVGRDVVGAAAATKPAINFDYAAGSVIAHTDDAPLDQLIKENLTLLAVDEVGVSNTPLQITVTNAEDGTNY